MAIGIITIRLHQSLYTNVKTKLMDQVKYYMPYRKIWVAIADNNSYLVEWLKYQDCIAGKTDKGKWYELLQIVQNII